MRRVSSSTANNDVQYNLRLQESKINKVNNQLGTQNRIQELRDDPLAAGRLIRYQSYAGRVDQFEKNAQVLSDDYSVAEGYINNSLQVMHRVRELALTGANGTYNEDDLRNIAVEVDELLKTLVDNANAVGPEGNRIFAGTRTGNIAFNVDTGHVEGSSYPLITEVRYNGSINQNKLDVDERTSIEVDKSGNSIFWAERQQLISNTDARTYMAKEDGLIFVNGAEIKISRGDNVYAVISKINDAGIPVKASLDPITNGLDFNTTDARQLWLEDRSGTVLKDLGIINDSSQLPPYNLTNSVRVSGGSLFDSVIALRDALLTGDTESIGSKVLASIDGGINNLVTHEAKLGSNYERAQQYIAKSETNKLTATGMIAKEGDLDFTQAVTDMKMLEYVKQATLNTASNLYDNTLLNYLR